MVKRGRRGPNAPAVSAMQKNIANLTTTNSLNASGKLIDVEFRPSIGISARKLEQLGIDIRSFREPLKRSVKQVLIPSIQANFDAGGRPSWATLSELTYKIKENGGYPDDPLIRTGALKRVAGQLNIWTFTEDTATIKALPDKVKYGYYHQAGASKSGRQESRSKVRVRRPSRRKTPSREISSGAIPARPFLVIQPEDRKDVEKVFLEWFEERAKRQWG